MTEAEKYAMRLIFPSHIADKYILYGKSIKDINPIELTHAKMRKEEEERKREKQLREEIAKELQDTFRKEMQDTVREELQKAMQK